MEKSSVIHFARDQFLYSSSETEITIMIMTKKDDCSSVDFLCGDPYDFTDNTWKYNSASMKQTGSDELYDYWRTTQTLSYLRARYAFKITGMDGESIFYTEKGFYEELPEVGLLFALPYLHHTEVFSAPEWVKNTVWYQIFPERFANKEASLNPKGSLPWASAEPTPTNFFGGDLAGIMDRLDYLKDLGINGIYFTPIFHAYSNHKYDTIDYMKLDPQFGTKETLKTLVDECHKRGIRVMLDAVFNHSGYHFGPFQDLLKNGENSRYKDWFHPHSLPLNEQDLNYDTFGFVSSMPKLNTKNPEVKEYLLDVATYWIKECDIDGWRLDVANEVDFDFWRDFRKVVKSEKEDAYILGEIWHDSMPWLRGDQFDAVMNYPFLTAILEMFSKETITARQFAEKMTKVYHMYPHTVNTATFNLVGSHDTPRILTECNGSLEKAMQIFTVLLTFSGTPCIYYGDEIGLEGEFDPGCRKCMPWDKEVHNQALKEHIQTLISLRMKHPVLANESDLMFMDVHPDIVGYKRGDDQSFAYILINISDNPVSIVLENEGSLSTLYMDDQTNWKTEIAELSLAGRGFAILSNESL